MHRSIARLKDSAQKSQMQPEAPTKIEGHGGRSDIHDVARLACVSIATVSRVTSGVTNVDRKLARRVWKVIEELGYSPSRAAQALGSGRTRLVGLIVPEINNPFFCELIQGFEDIALEHGYEMMLGSTYSNPERALSWLQRMLQHGVHGIAMMTFATEPDDIYRIARGVPIVSIQSSIPREPHTSIQIDFLAGIRQAVQHLAALRHREIGFAGADTGNYTAMLRRNAFITAMRELGLVVRTECLFEQHHTFEGGSETARQIIDLKGRPTGLVCSNDLIAIGVMGTLQQSGLNVPRDISVIGLDDIKLAQLTSPPLTTVVLPRRQLVERAFDSLLWQFDPSGKRSDLSDHITTSLVIRKSTTFAAPSLR